MHTHISTYTRSSKIAHTPNREYNMLHNTHLSQLVGPFTELKSKLSAGRNVEIRSQKFMSKRGNPINVMLERGNRSQLACRNVVIRSPFTHHNQNTIILLRSYIYIMMSW